MSLVACFLLCVVGGRGGGFCYGCLRMLVTVANDASWRYCCSLFAASVMLFAVC